MDTLIDIEVLRELKPLDQLDADGLATRLPPIDTVPALRKIAGGKLGPPGSIQILENARDELQELEALLVVP